MALNIRHSILTAPVVVPTTTWPKLSDTGIPTGTVLTTASNYIITASNITIQNTRFIGQVEVRGSNVTFRYCRFQQFYPFGILQSDGAPYNSVNCILDHCHFDGGNALGITAIGTLGSIIGCNIEAVTLGISCFGPQTITGNYIHNLDNASTNPNERHFDGIVSFGGGNHLIENNAIVMLPADGGTAAVSMNPTFGSIDNVTIKNNLCMGRAAYTIATEEATAVTIRDNFCDLGIYGWIASTGSEINNTLFNAGTPLQIPNFVNPIPHSVPPEVQAWLAKT